MVTAVISCIAALCIGMFLGNAMSALFGLDDSVVNTTNYSDRMSAVRSMFTDADQLDSYVNTALTFEDMDGLKLYTSRNKDKVLALWQGELVDTKELFDDEVQLSLKELMNTEDALYGEETTTGEAIEDVYLRNIAVQNGVVYYYLYYDEAGYIGIAFDSTRETLTNQGDTALPLTQTEDGDYEWFITYNLED
jgi:uncharacterized membrane protein YdfJ with MMPL/SSD domain